MGPTCHADKQGMDFLTHELAALAIAKVHEL